MSKEAAFLWSNACSPQAQFSHFWPVFCVPNLKLHPLKLHKVCQGWEETLLQKDFSAAEKAAFSNFVFVEAKQSDSFNLNFFKRSKRNLDCEV